MGNSVLKAKEGILGALDFAAAIAAKSLAAAERMLGNATVAAHPSVSLLWAVWGSVALGISVLVWYTGCVPIWAGLNDYVVLLDGAWRMHHGQIPHRDFYSVIGPLPLACLKAGFSWFGPSPDSLPKSMVLFGALFSGIGLEIARSRLPGWWPLLLPVVVLSCAAAPVPLGIGGGPFFGFRHQTTYAMFYNRLGWAALLPAMLMVFLPPIKAERAGSSPLHAILFGICIVSAGSTKVNFALACLILLSWWIISRRPTKRHWIGLAAGMSGALICYQGLLGNVAGYISDNITLFKVGRGESIFEHLCIRIHANRYALMAIGLLSVWIWYRWRLLILDRSTRFAIDRLLLAVVATLGLSLFVASFNWERAELPGAVVASLILTEMARSQSSASSSRALGGAVAAARCLALWLGFAYLTFDLGAVAYGAAWKARNDSWKDRCEQVAGEFFRPLPVPFRWNEDPEIEAINRSIHDRPLIDFPAVMMTSLQFTRWMNDGAELLTPYVQPTDRIFVADWLNPYNLIFQLPPARGGALLWDYKRMLDEENHPDVDMTMSEVTLIMVPKIAHLPAQSRFMVEIYGRGRVIPEHKVGESEFWTLFRVGEMN